MKYATGSIVNQRDSLVSRMSSQGRLFAVFFACETHYDKIDWLASWKTTYHITPCADDLNKTSRLRY